MTGRLCFGSRGNADVDSQPRFREGAMALKVLGEIQITGATNSQFDHGAYDAKTDRVFVAHTGGDRAEVIDHGDRHHLTTLYDFPEAAGAVADDGQVLVSYRGAAGLAWVDGDTLETRCVHATAP